VLDDQFVVDVFQTGSGTSTNMNANEVIAAAPCEILGKQARRQVGGAPNDHVNMGQSTNDVFPTAIHVAALDAAREHVLPAMRRLAEAFEGKGVEFADVVKAGRTHLQDAVPVTLGPGILGLRQRRPPRRRARRERPRRTSPSCRSGGTALGTGLNAHPEFAPRVVRAAGPHRTSLPAGGESFRGDAEPRRLRRAVRRAQGGRRADEDRQRPAPADLGAATGLNEIIVPATQPGSSIMPGKVNPVIPEAVNMVAAQVIGNDATIAVGGDERQPRPQRDDAGDRLQPAGERRGAGKRVRVFADKCVKAASSPTCPALRLRRAHDVAGHRHRPGGRLRRGRQGSSRRRSSRGHSDRQAILDEGCSISEERVAEILDLKKLTEGGRAG
jgi:fumarate hydratase, class II